jgi:hypothetical protein
MSRGRKGEGKKWNAREREREREKKENITTK